MKPLILTIMVALMLIACGDKTTINGYSDDQVKELLDANKDTVYQVTDGDSVLTYIYVTDTLYNNIVDTVYKKSVDTVYKTLYDTLSATIIDTVVNTLVDTVVTRVVDTVINTLVDTIYSRVIDTVFQALEDVGVETELPRDTTLTLYDTTDGTIIAKIYKGVVYKNTFYEAKEYQLGFNAPTRGYGNFFYSAAIGSVNSLVVTDYAREMNCSGACGIEGHVYMAALCGVITDPDYRDRAYKTTNIKRFSGWRVFDESDAYGMAAYLNRIVSDTTLVYLSTISYSQDYVNGVLSPFTANVAKYKVPSMVSNSNDKYNVKYVCAYDLN